MEDKDILFLQAKSLRRYDSGGLRVGIALACCVGRSGQFLGSLISQGDNVDESMQSSLCAVDKANLDTALNATTYTVDTTDDAHVFGSCQYHTVVRLHVSLLHHISELESDEIKSFTMPKDDTDDQPIMWIPHLTKQQLTHACVVCVVCVVLLHELAHMVHHKACTWLKVGADEYFEDLGIHLFASPQTSSDVGIFTESARTTPPKYINGVQLSDMGEMVEYKVIYCVRQHLVYYFCIVFKCLMGCLWCDYAQIFSGLFSIEGVDGSKYRISRIVRPREDGVYEIIVSAEYLQMLSHGDLAAVPTDTSVALSRELAKAREELPRGLAYRTYVKTVALFMQEINQCWLMVCTLLFAVHPHH